MFFFSDQNDTDHARVWISPTHAKRPVHSTIRFLCEVDYNGDYRIEWTFYGQRIPANSRIIDEIELEITDINPANSGKYTCLAKTDLGWSMVSSRLEVMSLGELIIYDVIITNDICFSTNGE